jgi:hypothetical protein
VDEVKARNFMYSLCPTWMISDVSSIGKSGGLLVAWNPIVFELQSFLSVGGILLTGIHTLDKSRICLLNAYGPCTGRRQFWDQVESKGLLAHDAPIIAGDINFTTSYDEVWGVGALTDPLAGFFRDLFVKNHLVDVHPADLVPTWRNGRSGVHRIQKWLDRVYAS